MAPLGHSKKRNAWLSHAFSHLDQIIRANKDLADCDDELPSEWAIWTSKAFLGYLNEQAQSLPMPSFSVGPNGTIGFTWLLKDGRLDVLVSEERIQAHLASQNRNESLSPTKVSCILRDAAA